MSKTVIVISLVAVFIALSSIFFIGSVNWSYLEQSPKESAQQLNSSVLSAYKLPPDPGEAGKQNLTGIDSDGDGVRDDIERYVAITESKATTRVALRDFIIAEQNFILNYGADVDTILKLDSIRNKASDCVFYTRGAISPENINILKALDAQILNTYDRAIAYAKADGKLSGHFFPLTKATVASCSFDTKNPPQWPPQSS